MPASKPTPPASELEGSVEVSQPYVGRWNTLVSTTNWEKGRIIVDWREALIAEDAAASEYSDEAWARLVGGVTGQHVGRLRRVFGRFGRVQQQYDGLYWSHFQAALDWEDAEMWLEGAVQNGWSVSQMRNQRWETLGAVAAERPRDEEIVSGELDEDFEPAQDAQPSARKATEAAQDAASPTGSGEKPDSDREPPKKTEAKQKESEEGDPSGAAIYSPDEPHVAFVRPFENLADLPDDLADAFESFKLAILRHKTAGWVEISREDVLASLDALKELALAPSADKAPF